VNGAEAFAILAERLENATEAHAAERARVQRIRAIVGTARRQDAEQAKTPEALRDVLARIATELSA